MGWWKIGALSVGVALTVLLATMAYVLIGAAIALGDLVNAIR